MRIYRQDRRVSATATHTPPSLLWRINQTLHRIHSSEPLLTPSAHAGDPARCAANNGRPRSPDQCQTFASTLPVGEIDRTDL